MQKINLSNPIMHSQADIENCFIENKPTDWNLEMKTAQIVTMKGQVLKVLSKNLICTIKVCDQALNNNIENLSNIQILRVFVIKALKINPQKSFQFCPKLKLSGNKFPTITHIKATKV